uniref:Uncharacterized protein n=1 Tax=Ciona intestinalis TaxID=7719 RepID=H2Y0H1_CIOIN
MQLSKLLKPLVAANELLHNTFVQQKYEGSQEASCLELAAYIVWGGRRWDNF